ncbi:MAG TPA: M48 family peptidase [Methylothermaceae bacterium]|nr:M48 family peptidase [Methylothermaceae bacterium]
MWMRLVSGLAILLMLVACTVSPTGRKQLMLMPEDQLTQMGLQAFEQIKQKEEIETDPRINAYVQCVVRELTRDLGGQWEVVVFRSDQANAFALPGGKIGVYTGLLKVASNQHQLAAVIGHEIGHVLARHSNERVSQNFALKQGMAVIQAIAAPQSPMGQLAMAALGLGAQFGILMPFSRLQESEADIIGLELMAKAGFDPREAIQLWHNMAQLGAAKPPEWLSTHPSHQTRINELQAHLPKVMPLYEQARARGRRPGCRL